MSGDNTLNPLRIAQFFALPGAAELVDAFSAIPPGPVRDSIVQHAQALATAGGWGLGQQPPQPPPQPAQQPLSAAPRPILEWQGPKPDPDARQAYVSQSMEGRIVERAMRGESVRAISEDTGIATSVIEKFKAKARKEAGVTFPGDHRTAKLKKKKGNGKGGFRVRMPLPEGPWWWEDPSSPIWETPYLLPGQTANAKGTMAAIGPNDRMGFAVMTKAANNRGITLREYIKRRQEIVRLVLKDGKMPAVAAEMVGEERHYASQLMVHVGYGLMDRVLHQAHEQMGQLYRNGRDAEKVD